MTSLTENARKVLENRYLRRNARGELIETPDDLFRRVAKAIAAAELQWGTVKEVEQWESTFYHLLSNLLFLPNSPTLMNAGTRLNQLSACFVLPVADNLNAIFTTLKLAALIQQSGGGTGFNFSHLRPQDDLVTATGGTAAGPVSFMKIFNAATEYVKQGGKRRGANMGILNVDHPDIEQFIGAKKQEGVLNNFNISVGISDAFMQAVEKKQDWPLKHPGTRATVKTVPAQALWEQIIHHAWRSGDPGLVFLDTIHAANPLPALGRICCTNPCGEVPLLAYEACNLGSVNLAKCVVPGAGIDWQQLETVIAAAIRFLDNVVELNHYLSPRIRRMTQRNRKIGLGVMGWADLLILLNIPYDSDAAIELAHRLMRFIRQKSRAASAALARQRGAFTNWHKSIYYPHTPLRNATLLSIAPTGTIAIIAGASSSIEPLFALAYQRQHVLDGASLAEVNPYFEPYLQQHQLYSPALLEAVKESGYLQNIAGVPPEVKQLFRTALEITPEWHLQHQLVFQQYVDNAVSKTINLPEAATAGEIDGIYQQAWQQKAKGVTIFRYHSKGSQVLEKGLSSDSRACKVCIA